MSLQLQNLSKSYKSASGQSVVAVEKLDLDIQKHDIVALLGASGCGKTSTLRMVAGFENVTEGQISFDGKRIDTLPPAKRGVAMAFEGYSLYPPLNVEENIGFGLTGSRPDTRRWVREIADMLEIGSILGERPARLSGGQQQRVSLARALARDADLYLLDEPMGQLEPQLRATLRGRIRAMIKQRGLTAILVTHDQSEANAMADRIAIMENGRLEQFGTGAELRNRPANLRVATFFGEPPMNVLSAEFGSGGLNLKDLNGAVSLDAPQALREATVVAGIRPIHVIIGQNGFQGTVVSNSWLGDQAHVVLSIGDVVIVSVSNDRVVAPVGAVVPFGFSTANLHIFDAATGENHHHVRDDR